MHRALIKVLVSLALAVGLSVTAGQTTAQATPAHTAVTTVAKATTNPCASQQRRVAQDRRHVANAHKALKRARHHHGKHHARKVRKAKRWVHNSTVRLNRARHARNACLRAHRTTSASPIQALCDAGVPQAVCDGLAGLIPGGTTSLPLSQLCSQVPNAQALCDALNGGTVTDVGSLQSLLTDLLNAVGLGDLVGTVGLGDLTDVLGNLGLGGLGL